MCLFGETKNKENRLYCLTDIQRVEEKNYK